MNQLQRVLHINRSAKMPNKPLLPTAHTPPATSPLRPWRWQTGQSFGRVVTNYDSRWTGASDTQHGTRPAVRNATGGN